MNKQHIFLGALVVSVFLALPAPPAPAQSGYATVIGGPAYDAATQTGFTEGPMTSPGSRLSNYGTAVGKATKFVAGTNLGIRAVRWDASGTATELDSPWTNSNGFTYATAYAVNDAGTPVGYATKYVSGSYIGELAVRWDASGTAATVLGDLGTDSNGSTQAMANAINGAGTAVGYAYTFVAGGNVGPRAVRWVASGTSATELGNLGTNSGGFTACYAYAVNDAGMAVGQANKYISGIYGGSRAVRWDASGTAATELGDIGTDSSDYTLAYAYYVNAAGTAVGYASKYVSGVNKGNRAVRWDGSGTAATELGNLGTDSTGYAVNQANAVNAAGTVVGVSEKYVGGIIKGVCAVRWDASGAATELGNLGTDVFGKPYAQGYGVSDDGIAVGYSWIFQNGIRVGQHAVLWGANGQAVDLNTWIASDSGWTLTEADAISANRMWVSGAGTYDPDGAGPLAAYDRTWTMQVPEPATLALLAFGAAAIIRRRQRV